MAGPSIRILLAGTLALSTGGLFLAAAALRRPGRAQLHLLRHDHQTGAAGELALTAGA